jgi:hypothetical protein
VFARLAILLTLLLAAVATTFLRRLLGTLLWLATAIPVAGTAALTVAISTTAMTTFVSIATMTIGTRT